MDQAMGLMAIDPATAAAVTLAEAELLRLEALRILGVDPQDRSGVLRDLSPLGRNHL
jgi:hypothetical protein